MADRRTAWLPLPTVVAMLTLACSGPNATIGNPPGVRAFTLPEISRNNRVAQQFDTPGGTLEWIDLHPVRLGAPNGTLQLDLWPVGLPGAPPLRTADVKASDFVRAKTFRFAFEPFRLPHGLCCYLEISSGVASTGVSLRANKGPGDDPIEFNGRRRWANLAFEAQVDRDLMPPVRLAAWAAIGALVASWIGIIAMIRLLWRDDALS